MGNYENINSSLVQKLNIALGGESGVGKTSLFNTISKLELPGRKNYQVEAVEDDHVQASFVHEEYPIVVCVCL